MKIFGWRVKKVMKKRYQDMAQVENASHRANGEALFSGNCSKLKKSLKSKINMPSCNQDDQAGPLSNEWSDESINSQGTTLKNSFCCPIKRGHHIQRRYESDQRRILTAHPEIDGINYFKIAGIYTYWIAKLKPIELTIPHKHYINEILALFLGLSISFTGYGRGRRIDYNFIDELLYTLRYRSISQEGWAIIFKSLML